MRGKGHLIGMLCAALAALSGCSPDRDLELIDVQEIDASVVEAGDALRIEGEGFPLGARAEIILNGETNRPGKDTLHLRKKLQGRAISEQRIEAPIEQSWIEEIGGRGTFHGTVQVRFGAELGDFALRADVPARIDFVPSTRARLQDAMRPGAGHASVADNLGIELGDDPDSSTGLQVEKIKSTGLGAEYGLRVGDRIEELNGVRLLMHSDFVVSETSSQLTMNVIKAGSKAQTQIIVPWQGANLFNSLDSDKLGWIAVLIGVVIGLLSPLLAWLFGLHSKANLDAPVPAVSIAWPTKLFYLALALALLYVLREHSLAEFSLLVGALFAVSSIPWLRRDGRLLWRYGGVLVPLVLMNIAAAVLDVTLTRSAPGLAQRGLFAVHLVRDPVIFVWFYLWLATTPRRLQHDRKSSERLRILGSALLMILGVLIWMKPWEYDLYDAHSASLALILLLGFVLWQLSDYTPLIWNRNHGVRAALLIALSAGLWPLLSMQPSSLILAPQFLIGLIAGFVAQWCWLNIPTRPAHSLSLRLAQLRRYS